MLKMFPNDYTFFPKTWHLPYQLEELKIFANHNSAANFIVKPEAMSQGKGIFITRKFDNIDPAEHYVVQKYIKQPYLIDGYKWDFRIYVLVTNVQPLRIFMFQEGLTRFATEQYKNKGFNNPFIHLTNYAINKDNSNYENPKDADAETGHKRSFKSMYSRFQKDGFNLEDIKA